MAMINFSFPSLSLCVLCFLYADSSQQYLSHCDSLSVSALSVLCLLCLSLCQLCLSLSVCSKQLSAVLLCCSVLSAAL